MSDWALVPTSPSCSLGELSDDENFGVHVASIASLGPVEREVIEEAAQFEEGHEDVLEPFALDFDLKEYAEPTKKRRGRPKTSLQGVLGHAPQPVAASSDALRVAGSDLLTSGSEFGYDELFGVFAWQGSLMPFSKSSMSMMVPAGQASYKKHRAGYSIVSVLSNALAMCASSTKKSETVMDTDYETLHGSELSSASHHCSSVVLLAEKLGISRYALEEKLMRLANAQVICCKVQRHFLEQELALNIAQGHLVSYVEHMSYDETPLKTPWRYAPDSLNLCTSNQSSMVSSELQASLKKLSGALKGDSVSSKVLQVKSKTALVFKVHGDFITIVYDTLCPLTLLGKASADVLVEALKRGCPTSSSAKDFQIKSRMVSIDGHRANLKCERGFLSGREEGWTASAMVCEAHMCSNIVNATIDGLHPSAVTGIISTALSLRHGHCLQVFRECLYTEIAQKLKLLRGYPSPDAMRFREQALELFMSGPSASLLDKVLMNKVPNGDWRLHGEVQFYTAMDMPFPSQEDVAWMLATSLVYIFLRSKPVLFARHRWTSVDVALDELGRLESCHGLLCCTYSRFLNTFGSQEGQLRGGGGCMASMQPLSKEAAPEDAMVFEIPLEDECLESGLPIFSNQVSADMFIEEKQSAEVHAMDRKKAKSWLQRDPFTDLVLCRIAVGPLMTLMGFLLQISGEAWENQQKANALKQMKDPAVAPRLFNVTVAADMLMEIEFFQNLAGCFSTHAWDLIPDQSRKVQVNSRAFRMLSRQGCMVQQQLVHLHSTFPYRMFKLLSKSAKPEDILGTPLCVLDDWSSAMLTKFPALSGPEFEATLTSHAMVACTTVAGIESRHSSIRRHLTTRIWACFLFAPKTIAGKKRKGAGGVWRAWVRYHTLGKSGKPNLGQLATKYRAAKAAGDPLLLELQKLAAAATLAATHKQNKSSSSFGLRGKDAKIVTKRSGKMALWRMCRGMGKHAKSKVLAKACSWDKTLPDPISAAKAVQYMD
eukprot:6491080-Amphidinium_carterae.1